MLINDRWLWRETTFSFELTQLMAAGGFSSGITASHRGLLPWSPGWFLWKIPYLSISKQEELSCNAFVSFCFSALNHLSYLAYICTCYILLRVHEESNKLDVLWKHTATFSAQNFLSSSKRAKRLVLNVCKFQIFEKWRYLSTWSFAVANQHVFSLKPNKEKLSM